MVDTPIIVISSPKHKNGSSVLALNLAGALWNDGYQVGLFSSNPDEIRKFLVSRIKFCSSQNIKLAQPKLLTNINDLAGLSAVIADISADKYQENEAIFNAVHTLITPLNNENDISWQPDDEYLNFIWKIKKNQASQGKKYLNWIIVPYLQKSGSVEFLHLSEASRRYGFRIAPAIYYRDEYMHISNGFCSADLRDENLTHLMSLNDVYARREILKLADFIWKKQ